MNYYLISFDGGTTFRPSDRFDDMDELCKNMLHAARMYSATPGVVIQLEFEATSVK